MITCAISFLPPLREVADLPVERRPSGRRRRRSPGICARTARIFGSRPAIASTWFGESLRPAGGMFEAATGIGASESVVVAARCRRAGRCSPSEPPASCGRSIARASAARPASRRFGRRGRPPSAAGTSDTADGTAIARRQRRAHQREGNVALRSTSRQQPEVRRATSARDVADRPLRGPGPGSATPQSIERAERVAARAASRGCRRRRAPGAPQSTNSQPGAADSSTSPEVGQVSADHSRARARRGRRRCSSRPSLDRAPSSTVERARRRSSARRARRAAARRARSAARRARGSRSPPRAGASWASRSSHITRSTPSIASARATTEARIASRSCVVQRVDHRRALGGADGDPRLAVARAPPTERAGPSTPSSASSSCSAIVRGHRRLRVVGHHDHRVLGEERVDAARRRPSPARAAGRPARSSCSWPSRAVLVRVPVVVGQREQQEVEQVVLDQVRAPRSRSAGRGSRACPSPERQPVRREAKMSA